MKNGTPRVRKMKSSPNPVLKGMKEAFYRQVNPRREQEIMDSRMIQEDHSQIANLSDRFINRQWDPDKYCQSLGRYDEKSEVGE